MVDKRLIYLFSFIVMLSIPYAAYAGEIVYSTYLNGLYSSQCNAITVDSYGNAYITGFTNASDFPVTLGSYDSTFNGGEDVIITKLNAAGTAIIFSTYLGGSNWEEGKHITLDRSGNIYVCGYTQSTTGFPTTVGAYDRTYNGGYYDIFISKLDATGSKLLYSTLFGGAQDEFPAGIAVNDSGNIYIAGYTSSSTNFPITANAYDLTYNGGGVDSFAAKFYSSGTALLYSTYLGGSGSDYCNAMAIDASGNIYLTGYTSSSTSFPITPAAYNTAYNGGINDVYVTKINPTGTGLVYSTFIGGRSDEYVYDLQVDTSGNAYICGYTSYYVTLANGAEMADFAYNFPVTPGAYDQSFNGIEDIYITKFNPSGSDLVFSTYLGGQNTEEAFSLALDIDNNVYVTGNTMSSDFPTTRQAFDTSYNGGMYSGDAFISKFNATGSKLLYSTFLGGSSDDYGRGVVVDHDGKVYACGYTESTDFPVTAGAVDTTFVGYRDGYVSKIDLSIPTITGVAYNDIDSDGKDAGDKLFIQFDHRMKLRSALSGYFYLGVPGDTLGTGATVSLNTANDTQVIITLGTSPKLTITGLYGTGAVSGSPSGIDINAFMPSGHITDITGLDAIDGGILGINDSGIDIKANTIGKSYTIPAYSAATVQVDTNTTDAFYTKHKLVIPAGALTKSATIYIGFPGDTHNRLSAVKLIPPNISFNTTNPPTLYLEYKDADICRELGYIEQGMRIHQWKNTSQGWVLAPQTFGRQVLDLGYNRVAVKLNKFNMVGATGSFDLDDESSFAANTNIVFANIAIPTVGAITGIYAPVSIKDLSETNKSDPADAGMIAEMINSNSVTLTVATTGIYTKHKLTLTNFTTAYSGVTVILAQPTLIEYHGWPNYSILKVIASGQTIPSAILAMEYKDYTDPYNQFKNDVIGGEESQLRIYLWREDLGNWSKLTEPQTVNLHTNMVTATLSNLTGTQIFAVGIDSSMPATPYLNTYGAFTIDSDQSHWMFEKYADGTAPGTLSWVASYTGRSGIIKIQQSPGQKGKLTQVFSVPSTGWYTAIAKVCSDFSDISKHQKVYLYLQQLDTDYSVVATGNQVIQSAAGGFTESGQWREMQISFYATNTILGVQVIGVNPSTSGITGGIYFDDIWVYAGGPAPSQTIALNNPSFTSDTSGWMAQVYADGTGLGTWSWVNSWSGHNGALKGVQTSNQKAKWSQLVAFPDDDEMALGSVWVYSAATTKTETQKIYLYLYSHDASYGKIIESGSAIYQGAKWTPGVWQQLQFGYTPYTLYNSVQLVGINPSGRPTETIYFDEVVVKQD
ncbi:MAG: SBBP repeat-containing protein [bacterium]